MLAGAGIGEFNPKQISAMTHLFSSGIIRELALKGKSPAFSRLAKSTNLESRLTKGARSEIRDIYDAAYDVLKDGDNRCAYIYKNVLTQKRFLGIHSLKTASLLTEFRVGNSKADVVILNGTSTAYEIKSERDSFARLDGQLNSYLRVFDNVYVVSSEDNCGSLVDVLPPQVGIMALNRKQCVSTIRRAISNKDNISPEILFDSMTRIEAEDVLRLFGIPIPQLPNTLIRSALRSLFVDLGAARAHDGAIAILKHSRSLFPLGDFLYALPDSLKAAGAGTPIPPLARERLVRTLDLSLSAAYAWS
jgi:hypothetical protein